MSSRLKYIAGPLVDISELALTRYYEIGNESVIGYKDIIVYSLSYDRITYNTRARLEKAKLNIYFCETVEDFVSMLNAIELGADLSNLWSK